MAAWRLGAVAAGVLLAGLVGLADARMHAPYRGHRILPSGALLDGGGSFSTSVAGAYSFRKLKSTYAGPALRIRRASDNGETDINFLGCTGFTGCPWDSAAATAHCAATTCWLRWWYDQSGVARDIGNATAASQLQLIFNCNGTLPCFRNTAVASQAAGSTVTPVPVSPLSISTVSNRSVYGGGSSECIWFRHNNTNRVETFAAPWYLAAAAALAASPQPTDNVWHAQQGVINGAASVINIDGVETTGTVAVDTVAGSYLVGTNTAAATTCQFAEAIYWSGYALTPAERAFLRTNQQSFWGTP